MVIDWFRFVLRQLATALVVVTSILLLSEILLPASVLPYFNLHILVLVTIVIAVASPVIDKKSRLRVVLLIPLAALLLAYAWIVFGTSTSGLALFGALAIVLVGVTVALGNTSPSVPLLRKEREVGEDVFVIPADAGIQLSEETIIINDDGIEIDETSVFMR